MTKPIKILIPILLILFATAGYGQNSNTLRNQAKQFLDEGKFEQSLALLNKITDKETLETTTVNFQKTHLRNILKRNFSKKQILHDSVYKVKLQTNYLKAQGVYDAKSKNYLIQPIYDSIARYKDYFVGIKNDEKWLFDSHGKTIMPLGEKRFQPISDYRVPDKYFILFEGDSYLGSIYNYQGELIFKNLNLYNFYEVQIPYFVTNRLENGQTQILDLENRKIAMDSLDDFADKTFYYHNNEIISSDIEGFHQQFTMIKSKKGNYVAHNIDNKIVRTTDFDSYVDDLGYFANNIGFDNNISRLINFKKNITLKENQFSDDFIYLIVKKNSKFGIYDLLRSRFYKEPIYDSISEYGNTFYEGKWINLVVGKEIIKPMFDFDRVIIFRENNKIGLMQYSGNILLEADYDEINYFGSYSFLIRKGTKWGYFNHEKNPIFIEPKFDYIIRNNKLLDAYLNQKITKLTLEGKKAGKTEVKTLKSKNYISFDSDFSNQPATDRLLFKKDKLYGLDDLSQAEVVPASYTRIQLIRNNTFIVTQNDSLQGLIDHNGKILIPIKYKQVSEGYLDNHLMVNDWNNLTGIFSYEGKNEYPFVINSFNDFRLTKSATYTIIQEEIDTKPVSYFVNGTPLKAYGQALLKLENDKVTKIGFRGYSFKFLKNDYVFFWGTNSNNSNSSGFYSLKTDKYIEIPNKGYIEIEKNKSIMVRKDLHYDTLIDSTLTVTSLKVAFNSYQNEHYFFNIADKTGVMDEQFKMADFQYPVLLPFFEYRDFYVNYSPEFKAKVNSFFKFNTNAQSKRHGVISFDGKIIANPEKHDQITLYNSSTNEGRVLKTNPYFKKYDNQLFIGSNTKKNAKEITLFTPGNSKLAQFLVNDSEAWNLSLFNNAIIITGRDSVSVFNVQNQKKVLKIKLSRFQEREDGSYANIIYTNAGQSIQIYDTNGKLLEDKSSGKKEELISGYMSYVVKENNKYGTINAKSEKVIPTIYDDLKPINNLKFIAKKNNKQGVIDASNLILLDIEYDAVIDQPTIRSGWNMSNIILNVFEIRKNNQIGILNADNFKTIIPTEFDKVKTNPAGFVAQKDSVSFVYDFTGKLYFKAVVDSVIPGVYGGYKLYKKGKEVYRDKEGKLVNENPIKEEDWLTKVKLKYGTEKDGKYYLAHKNQIIHEVPLENFIGFSIHDNENDKNLYFFIVKDEKGKAGLIDEEGNPILPFGYDEILPLKVMNYVAVKKDGKFGVVNFKNELVLPFRFDKVDYDYYSLAFECQIGKTFYRITPQDVVLFKGDEEDFNKGKRPDPIYYAD